MNYLGDIRLGDTIDTKFVTTAAATGAPTTLAGTPVISAYVGNSVTQITAGITLTVDFDAVTGLHNVRVVATGANGYATASNYQLVITTGTVGGTSAVGYVVGEFSIEARSALMPTVAARTLDVTATGAAGIDWANVENPTTALNLSATNIDVDQVVASVSGAVGSVTGGVVLSGVTHTGAVIPTVSVLTGHTAQTGDNFARIGAAGAGLTALGDTRIANLDTTLSSRATPAQILTTALTESYAADGAAPTLAQSICLIQQTIGDFSISGTTLTVKKLDGTTSAATYTLDDATNPTSRTRAT